MGKPTLLHVILGYCLFAARTGFSSIALAAGNNTTPASEKNMTGECKWNVLNSVLVSTLLVSTMVNVFAAVILFRVPLITSRGRSNPVYLCIRCLNLSDIAQSLLLVMMPVFADNDCNWIGGQVCCSILGFLTMFLVLVSSVIIILMAWDRANALYRPFDYHANKGLKTLQVLLPLASIIVLVVAVLPLAGVGEYHVVRGRRLCLLDTITDDYQDKMYIVVVHCGFALALIFMAGCTMTFQLKLWQASGHIRHRHTTRRTRNATITTMAVCLIFVVCYLPYVVRVLYETITEFRAPKIVTFATFGIAFLQPLLNPFVYISANFRYRNEFLTVVHRMRVTQIESSTESVTSQYRRRNAPEPNGKRYHMKNCSGRTQHLSLKLKNGDARPRPRSVYALRSIARSHSDAREDTGMLNIHKVTATL